MSAVAGILVAVGIIALIAAAYFKFKGGRLTKTPLLPTGQAGTVGEKNPVSVQGQVECAETLISPVTQTPCLYYELIVEGSWKEGDSTKKKDYVRECITAAVTINDGSGPVPVTIDEDASLDLNSTFDETKKEGLLADLKGAVGKGKPIMFGSYAFENPPMSRANKFRCTERILPVTERAFALGKLKDGALASATMFGLVFTPKTRDELLGSNAKHMKMSFIGGASAAGLGLILGLIALATG